MPHLTGSKVRAEESGGEDVFGELLIHSHPPSSTFPQVPVEVMCTSPSQEGVKSRSWFLRVFSNFYYSQPGMPN